MLLLFSRWVVSDSLRSHGLQHTSLPCPSLSPRVCSNSSPLSQWCHPTISPSVTPFSSCSQSFPASGSFPVSQLFASVLPMNIQGWFPLQLTGLISLLSKDSQESSPAPQFDSINSLVVSFLYGPTLTSVYDYYSFPFARMFYKCKYIVYSFQVWLLSFNQEIIFINEFQSIFPSTKNIFSSNKLLCRDFTFETDKRGCFHEIIVRNPSPWLPLMKDTLICSWNCIYPLYLTVTIPLEPLWFFKVGFLLEACSWGISKGERHCLGKLSEMLNDF